MVSKTLYSSKSDEWATPDDIYERLDKEFDFNLDPCATKENAKVPWFFTIEEDGLKQPWGGQECFVIHLTQTLAHGWRRHLGRHGMTIR